MFGLLKNQSAKAESATGEKLTELTFKIDGMHCTSCALNIDADLEDLPGVTSARTNYAKSTTQVVFDPQQVTRAKIEGVITKAGYQIHT